MKKLIIVGDAAFAEIAFEYFTDDSDYEVVAFSVESQYLTKDACCGLPVVPFEKLTALYPPETHEIFVALTYGSLNRVRKRLYEESKAKGYTIATYISSRAFVWKNVSVGENCFIFENNTVQPFVTIGNNTIVWSGNHIGHHSKIGNHVFISSHVVISGFDTIGDSCFLGVNATLINNLDIAEDCWIGPGCTVTKNTLKGSFFKPNVASPVDLTTYRYFKIESNIGSSNV